MLINQVKKCLVQHQFYSVNELLLLYNIKIKLLYNSENNIHDATILISAHSSTIYLKDGLDEQYTNYLILHELGHFLIDYSLGCYNYSNTSYKSRNEFKANLFACCYLLKDCDLYDLNIVEYLINNGCPYKIANHIFDYFKSSFQIGNFL